MDPAARRKACAPPVPSPQSDETGSDARRQKETRCATPCSRRALGSGEQTAERRFQPRRVWPRHRRPERAEYRPSAAGRFRAAASAPFWLKASSESGATGSPGTIRPDGLRFAEIFAAPNGGKAAVLLRMSRESAIERQPAPGNSWAAPACIPRRNPHDTGEAAQAENDPEHQRGQPKRSADRNARSPKTGVRRRRPRHGFLRASAHCADEEKRAPRKRRAARRTDGRKAARLFRRWRARRAIRRFCGCIDKHRRRKSAERVSTRRGLRACPYCFQKNTARRRPAAKRRKQGGLLSSQSRHVIRVRHALQAGCAQYPSHRRRTAGLSQSESAGARRRVQTPPARLR